MLKRKTAKLWREVLAEFGVDNYSTQGDLIITSCPVHLGSYQSAFNLNTEESSEWFGSWFCNSHKCHLTYGRDMVGLVLGLIRRDNPDATFIDAVKFCERLTKDVKIDYEYKKFDAVTNFFTKQKVNDKVLLTRDQVRSKLEIPATYYITERKFSPEILDSFDVGYCSRSDSQMCGRVVFPVYDETGNYMIGCIGRRLDDGPNKWINSKGFSKSSHLYGYNKAIKRAREVGAIVLVEGQGDTIRMHEAGMANTVGIFGASLSDAQEFLIQKTGVMNVVVAMDSDGPGQLAYESIHERLRLLFNVIKLDTPKKDIGEMTVGEVQQLRQNIRKYV